MCKTNDVIDRLGLTGIEEPNGGHDYYHYIASFPIKFWYLTGETLQTFGEVVVDMRMSIIFHDRTYRRNRVRRRIRVQRLNITNRLLLVFIWLRRYLRMQTLAMMFKVDVTYVSKIIQEIVPLLLEKYSRQVVWPTLEECRGWLGHGKKFPSCVGIIDATTHPIWPPSQRQAMFYRGDKKKHFMSSHVIVTPDEMIVNCSAAFPGHLNDTNGFNMMPRIGPQCALDLLLAAILFLTTVILPILL
ncbi:uncharacterized protein LOC116304842 [Actinia tenebrosa]|uniref:Uncharacterized protein LOC116304842 n=1 Tax=Actinia tenebrosa TaxID=6105 RepID=A0A6P8IU94_ACTTE|nr:uncharacterized protein LOC116304842 [Actinia tenebrosa]